MAHVAELDLAKLQRQQQAGGQDARETGQARVFGERVDERPGLNQLPGRGLDFIERGKQQAIVIEERAAGGFRDGDEFLGLLFSAAVSSSAAASANSGARASTTTSTVDRVGGRRCRWRRRGRTRPDRSRRDG